MQKPTLRSHPAGKHIVFYIVRHDHIAIVQVLHERMSNGVVVRAKHRVKPMTYQMRDMP